MHSCISRLRVSHKSSQRKRRNETENLFEELFEELRSILPSLPKGAGEIDILTKGKEYPQTSLFA
jgi:hypothetical protein